MLQFLHFPPSRKSLRKEIIFFLFFFSRKYRKFKRRSGGRRPPVEKEIGRVIFKQEREGRKNVPTGFFEIQLFLLAGR